MIKSAEIKTSVSTVSIADDGIVRVVVDPEGEETLKNAEEVIAAIAKIGEGRLHPVLVDTRSMKSIEVEARKYYASDERPRVGSAVALLVGSTVSMVIGNFWLTINKPSYPSHIFSSEESALEWLKGYS